MLDENVPVALGRHLRSAGHDVALAVDRSRGAPDTEILALACSENRILLSFDRDFGDLIFAENLAAPAGVVYLRIEIPSPERVESLGRMLAALQLEDLRGQFTVITAAGMRQRSFPVSA